MNTIRTMWNNYQVETFIMLVAGIISAILMVSYIGSAMIALAHSQTATALNGSWFVGFIFGFIALASFIHIKEKMGS